MCHYVLRCTAVQYNSRTYEGALVYVWPIQAMFSLRRLGVAIVQGNGMVAIYASPKPRASY